MPAQGVMVQGPDGSQYSFPDGTTKEAAIAYFKKKGIGGTPKQTTPMSPTALALEKQVLASKMEEAQGQSTVGSRARESAIGVLEPLTIPNVAAGIKTVATTVGDLGTVTNPDRIVKGVGELRDLAKGIYHAAVDPLSNYIDAIKTGDYDKAANASGGILSQTVPTVGMIPGAESPLPGTPALPNLNIVGKLREGARNTAKTLTGSGNYRVTTPMIDKFNEGIAKTAESQTAANAAVAGKNAESAAAAAETNRIAAEAAAAKTAELKAGHVDTVNQTLQSNRDALLAKSRAEGITRSVEEGSKRLGESVNDLNLKLREEANGKYAKVRELVSQDPGVPLTDMAQAAREAQAKLKGSTENIKQFRELIRTSPEESAVHTSAGDVHPGDRLYDMLAEQGLLETGGSIPFDELQGYSSEIGRKLAQGGVPGDIYQALKYLKDKIDTAKGVIAERNNAGLQLKDADSFYHDYMDLFYDKDSSIAKVREGYGNKNASEAFNDFLRGKSDEVAIGRLNKLNSVYAPDAKAVANLAQNLKSASAKFDAIKPGKVAELPAAPKPVVPKVVEAKVEPNKVIAGPEAPTAQDIVNESKSRVESKAYSFTELQKRDMYIVGAGVIGGLLRDNWIGGLGGGLAVEGAVKGAGALLNVDAVKNWIAQPTEATVQAAARLPEPYRATLVNNLREMIEKEKAAGRPIPVDPAVQKLLGTTIVTGAAVKSRREAMDSINRPVP